MQIIEVEEFFNLLMLIIVINECGVDGFVSM